MENFSSNFKRRSLAVLFSLCFLIAIGMVILTFIKPEAILNCQNQEINTSLDTVWKAIYDKKCYLTSKKEIIKYVIYDTILPRWSEYYTPSDSVENKVTKMESKRLFCYTIMNRKYEQVNGIAMRLDSISQNKTKVTIVECSQYFNSWASIYFKLFHPKTVIDYEFVKIKNTIQFIKNPEE